MRHVFHLGDIPASDRPQARFHGSGAFNQKDKRGVRIVSCVFFAEEAIPNKLLNICSLGNDGPRFAERAVAWFGWVTYVGGM